MTMLIRYHGGETTVWNVVRVPQVADEDGRQLHRELETLKKERTEHGNRIKGLLASLGLALKKVDAALETDGASLEGRCRVTIRALEAGRRRLDSAFPQRSPCGRSLAEQRLMN